MFSIFMSKNLHKSRDINLTNYDANKLLLARPEYDYFSASVQYTGLDLPYNYTKVYKWALTSKKYRFGASTNLTKVVWTTCQKDNQSWRQWQ